MSKAVRLAAATLCVLPALARADIQPVGPEFRVNTYTTGNQYEYRTAACGDPTGDFVVVWQSDGQEGGSYSVFGQRFRDAAPLGTEFRVNAYTTGNQQAPGVACLPDGTFFVVWADDARDGSMRGIFGQRLDGSGGPLGADFQVNTYTGLEQNIPHVITTRDGVLVVWTGADADSDGVFGQRFGSDGARVGTEFQLNTYTTDTQRKAFPADDGAGGFVVVWEGGVQDGDNYGVLARRWGSDGMPAGTEFVVNGYTTGVQLQPSVARTPTGFVVVWEGAGPSVSEILARRLDAAGTPLGTEFRVNTYTTGQQRTPSVASDAEGRLLVMWASPGQDGSSIGVYGQRYASDGTPLGSEFQANSYTTGPQGFYTVPLVDADGDFLVVWATDGQDGSGIGVDARLFRDPCGDGTVGPGETCDDGSRLPGDCCTPTCQATVAAGTACAADGVDCTTDACDGAGACGHTADHTACPACRRCDATAGCVARPRTDCRRPTRARQASLALTNKNGDKKDRLAYAWKRGAETTLADFGALPASPDYSLCVFDKTGGVDRLVLDATVPAGGGWKKKGSKGFRYKSGGGAPDGVTSVVLQSGRGGKAMATVSGKGAGLALPPLGLTPPVTAAVQAGNDGVCFGAEFGNATKNTATTFRAKGQ